MLIREDLRDDFHDKPGVCPVCTGLLFAVVSQTAFWAAILWVAS